MNKFDADGKLNGRSTGAAPRAGIPTAPMTPSRSRRHSSTRWRSPAPAAIRCSPSVRRIRGAAGTVEAAPGRDPRRVHLWRAAKGTGAAEPGGSRLRAGVPSDHSYPQGNRPQGTVFRSRKDPVHRGRRQPPESDALIDELTGYMIQPDAEYRHKWRVGDIVIWDNRCSYTAPPATIRRTRTASTGAYRSRSARRRGWRRSNPIQALPLPLRATGSCTSAERFARCQPSRIWSAWMSP